MSKIVTLGEIMLRLKSPGHERFMQSPYLEATFGGGEANVAVSLSVLGKDVSYVSAVPKNPIGDAVIQEIKKYGIDTQFISKAKNSRLGIYFLETGSCVRPSVVVYDRENSAIATANPLDFNWNNIFKDCTWFHLTGITPAISQTAADISLEAVKMAKKLGLTVSVDLNYRKKLWNYGKAAPEVMKEIVKSTDVLIANEEDIQNALGINNSKIDVSHGQFEIENYKSLVKSVIAEYQNINYLAITLRESFSADKNGWGALLYNNKKFYESKKFYLEDIVDRVGGGDAFSAGLIYGLTEYQEDCQFALDFAVAASAIKHTIPGDFNLAKKSEVLSLMEGNSSGRVQR